MLKMEYSEFKQLYDSVMVSVRLTNEYVKMIEDLDKIPDDIFIAIIKVHNSICSLLDKIDDEINTEV